MFIIASLQRGVIEKETCMPDRLVYSTDGGRVSTCPVCGKPYKQCRCKEPTSSQMLNKKTDGIVRVLRDRKHRGGKTVTVIDGGMGSEAEPATLGRPLKEW